MTASYMYASDVLTNPALMQHIARFQRGLPRDVIELARVHGPAREQPPCHTASVFPSSPPVRSGVLPLLAIKHHDLRLLQRLDRCYTDQTDYFNDDHVHMSFRCVWRDSLEFGDDAIVAWVHDQPALCEPAATESYPLSVGDCLFAAIVGRNSGRLQWLLTQRPEYKQALTAFHLQALVSSGENVAVFQWLEQHVPTLPYTPQVMYSACGSGCLELVKYLHDTRPKGCTTKAMVNAARHGHVHILEFLHEHRSEGCTADAMDYAAAHGQLAAVQFLHERRLQRCTARAISATKSLEVLQFLHEQESEGWSTDVMDQAAARGDLAVVRFLHENRSEGCSPRAMEDAGRNGHVHVVEFLYKYRTEGNVATAIVFAASEGQLHVLEYLVPNSTSRPRDPVVLASRSGYLDVVHYLTVNSFPVDYLAVQNAATGGHLPIVKYLLDLHPELCHRVICDAAAAGHTEIVQYLHENFHDKCTPAAVDRAAFSNQIETVRYLITHCDQVSGEALLSAARQANLELVRLLVESQPRGCLIRAREQALQYLKMPIVDYLDDHIDPVMDSTSDAHVGCHENATRECGRRKV